MLDGDWSSDVCSSDLVREDDEIMVTTSNGIIIRVPVSGIRVQGRATQGVKIMNVEEKDRVVGVATLAKEEENGEGGEQRKLEESGGSKNE
jgi:DNA gyrase subunit A